MITKKQIHLTDRLKAVAEMVNCKTVADIGCDHGRLAVSLLQQGKADFAYASDISPASVAKTEALAKKCGMHDKMHITCADGLKAIADKAVDAIIIAGMGGILISEILDAGAITAKSAQQIIMQPMRGDSELRQYLYENRYSIIDERLVFEDKRAYPIICARYTGEYDNIPDFFPKRFYEVSYYLAKKRDKNLHRYLHMQKERLTAIMQSKPNSEAERFLHSIDKILDYYNKEENDEAK